jgi:predicted RNA-binding Zn ribbon-like protein
MPEHYKTVDGCNLPARLSGDPALDFCNTCAGWNGPSAKDYLSDYEHLAVWAGFVALLPAERVAALRQRGFRHASAASETLERARRLRTSLYRVLVGGGTGRDFALVAHEAQAAAASLRLCREPDGVRWELAPDNGLAAPIAAVAWAAGRLITSPQLPLVRVCPGTGCGWLFLDPRGRRRWCTMATCGNRAKVGRFAARRRD